MIAAAPVRPLAGGRLGGHGPRMAEATISQRYGRRPDKGAPAVAVGGGAPAVAVEWVAPAVAGWTDRVPPHPGIWNEIHSEVAFPWLFSARIATRIVDPRVRPAIRAVVVGADTPATFRAARPVQRNTE